MFAKFLRVFLFGHARSFWMLLRCSSRWFGLHTLDALPNPGNHFSARTPQQRKLLEQHGRRQRCGGQQKLHPRNCCQSDRWVNLRNIFCALWQVEDEQLDLEIEFAHNLQPFTYEAFRNIPKPCSAASNKRWRGTALGRTLNLQSQWPSEGTKGRVRDNHFNHENEWKWVIH